MTNGGNLTLNEIMKQIQGVELNAKKGGSFRFKMHLTPKMEETSIEGLELSIRSYHCLKRAGFETIGQLTDAISKGSDLKKIRNCGAKSVREIMEKLFVFQYESLSAERRERWLREVVELNVAASAITA